MSANGPKADIDNHGALTICLHAGGNPASVKAGFGLRGGGCSVWLCCTPLLRSVEEVMVKPHAAFGPAAGSLTRSTAQTSSAAYTAKPSATEAKNPTMARSSQ
jgi:hypothetical protein